MAEDGKTSFALKTSESDRTPESSGPVDPDQKSIVQPGVWLSDYAEELEGEFIIPQDPRVVGGYAEVYQGQWKRSDGVEVEVAVKVFKPLRPKSISEDTAPLKERLEKRLKREVVVWTRIKHPNIHPLLGFWSQTTPCLVSTWCAHGNLKDYLKRNSEQLSRLEKVQLMNQAAEGLAYLHSQSPPICHADIKPENILVNDLREAVLSDFGLSRVMMLSSGLTTSVGPKGSDHYMAPELFEGNPRPTLECDVFAFGGLMLTVLSGKPPFAGLPPARIMYSVLRGQHPKWDQHPPLTHKDSLWSLMLQCWARNRLLRPKMPEVVIKLKNEVSSLTPTLKASGSAVTDVNLNRADRPRTASGLTSSQWKGDSKVSAQSSSRIPQSPRRDRWSALPTFVTSRKSSPSPTRNRVISGISRGINEDTSHKSPEKGEPKSTQSSGDSGIQWPIVLQYLKYLERRGDIRYEEKISQEPQLGLNGTWVVELLLPDHLKGELVEPTVGKGVSKSEARAQAYEKVIKVLGPSHTEEMKKMAEAQR